MTPYLISSEKKLRDTGQLSSSDTPVSPANKASNPPSATKRMSISLSGDAARLLQELADSQGISQSEALRRAIATEAYLWHEREAGSKVLLQKSNDEIREVVFR